MVALLFDLDGTLIDTVYAHVLAWQVAFEEAGLNINGWRIHRRIGMSGGLFTRAAVRELGHEIEPERIQQMKRRHGELVDQFLPRRCPLPGAVELLKTLREAKVTFGIATSGTRPEINRSLDVLGIGSDVVVVDRNEVARAKPEPDLFLACQQRLGVRAEECCVVGDAVWDLLAARRAGMMSVGFLSGGYGEEELYRAGALRVYRDAEEFRHALYEIGIRL